MFDRIVVNRSPSHITKTVHEHRAPTDESMKLLNEMEEKLLKKIVMSAVLVGDGIEVPFIISERSPVGFGYELRALFKLNGREEWVRVELNDVRMSAIRGDAAELAKLVAEEMGSRITTLIFARLMTAVQRPGEVR